MKIKLITNTKTILADNLTPVAIYNKLRDEYPNALLLESSDYHSKDDNYSYICCRPIAKFTVAQGYICTQYPKKQEEQTAIKKQKQVVTAFENFCLAFQATKQNYTFTTGGVFGYSTYDAVQNFENLTITKKTQKIPEMLYQFFSIVIVFEHFQEKLHIFEYQIPKQPSIIKNVLTKIQHKQFTTYPFWTEGVEQSNYTDQQFIKIIEKGIWHCQRGDVFQVVLSRKFYQKFHGDEWNIYRMLRSINPSPYLFYFDYGSFKIFGSSPEAQIIIKKNEAAIYPIAGCFKRSGDDKQDAKLAKQLFDNKKENAEHCMLVDLARNDLSKQGRQVKVVTFKEIQYYSHVIHMVSKVVAKIKNISSIQLFADTFPAGTLSGAPKYKAMQIIDNLETSNREFYGGAIGYLGFKGELNHAIMIRTILSCNGILHYQAGSGIVCLSNKHSELQEANNKKAALKFAIEKANEEFNKNTYENSSS